MAGSHNGRVSLSRGSKDEKREDVYMADTHKQGLQTTEAQVETGSQKTDAGFTTCHSRNFY